MIINQPKTNLISKPSYHYLKTLPNILNLIIQRMKKYNNNKNNVSTELMDLNEYQQSLIKCQYMSTVCDQLFHQLESKVLSKILQRNKLISSEMEKNQFKKYDRIESQFKQLSAKMQKEYQQKAKHLDIQIKQQSQHIKKLKIQISLLEQSRYEGAKSNRLNFRKIRQVSELQNESIQLRKLLNFQLQNLNSLEVGNIELNETIQKYGQRQIQLKLKIKKVVENQNQYFRCKDMQDNYEALLIAKRKLVQQNALFDSQRHQDIFNKISDIAQAKQNIDQMNRYENQLGQMIKEKKFIIQEIQKREELHKKNLANVDDSDNDTQIFQEEIDNLRKTIANRKFQQKTKSIHTSNKLEAFINDPTTKNSIHYQKNEEKDQKKKQKHESIFKIQIEPISHLNQSKNPKKEEYKKIERQHRNSMPTPINKKPVYKSPQKHTQMQKDYLSENKLPDFDTIEIASLERIIKDKESRMKQVMQTNPIPSQFSGSPINEQKDNNNNNKVNIQVIPLVRNSQQNKKIMITQPIQPKYKSSQNTISRELNNQNQKATPNSRFIEQIIESTSGQNIEKLKNNVRFRTKKSQREKYRHLEEIEHKRKIQLQKMKISQSPQSKFTSSKTVQPAIDHLKNLTPKPTPAQQNNNKKVDLSFSSMYENQFMGIDTRQNASLEKQHKLKYKDKIQGLTYDRSSLNHVLEKIDLLKKIQLENIHKITRQDDSVSISGEKKQLKDKVKIFKLSSQRKYTNGTAFSRKGKAEGIEDFESEQEESILAKITEEDESIKNTLQSIVHVQQKS